MSDIKNLGSIIDMPIEDFKKSVKCMNLGYIMTLNNYLKLTYDNLANNLRKDILSLEPSPERDKVYSTCIGVLYNIEEKVLYLTSLIKELIEKDLKNQVIDTKK